MEQMRPSAGGRGWRVEVAVVEVAVVLASALVGLTAHRTCARMRARMNFCDRPDWPV